MLLSSRSLLTTYISLTATFVSIAADPGSASSFTDSTSTASGWSAWLNIDSLWGVQNQPNLYNSPQFEVNFEPLPQGAASGSELPWSQPPRCLTVPQLTEPLCVFTQTTFAQGRGVAVITVPSQASQFAQRAQFHGGSLPNEVNQPDPSGVFEERIFPNAGRGLVATQDLNPGRFLYAFSPLLFLHSVITTIDYNIADALRWEAVLSLPPRSQESFWNLAAKQDRPRDDISDRIDVNAFHQKLHDISYVIVIPEAARLNHDCRPNAIVSFDPQGMAQYTHIIRPVNPGEELKLSYIDVLQPTAQRQALLQEWGFRCNCAICNQQPAQTNETDRMAREIYDLLIALVRDHSSPNGPTYSAKRSVDMAERIILLIEQERITSAMATAATHLALAHSSACHYDQALAAGQKAILYGRMEWGYDAAATNLVRNLVNDIRAHPSWASRMSADARMQEACAA